MRLLKDKYDYIFLTIGILILSIVIFFPLSSDLAAFIQGGIALKNGGHLYVNYFDVKPPFVYYLFEFFYTLFGKNITIYRVFDVAYMTSFLLSSIYVFNRLGFNKNAIRLFTVLMPLAYTSLDFPSANQVETLLFLPLIWYFYLSSKPKKNKFDILIKGILLGIAINLKYTFGIILVADILYLIIQKRSLRYIIAQSSIQLLIAIFISFIVLLPILISGNFDAFISFINYMKGYSNYPPLGGNFILHIIKVTNSFYTDNYSLFLFLPAIFAIYYIGKENEKANILLSKGLIIYTLILFCSVVIERKMFPYHEQRLYPFLVMLSSIGIILLLPEFKKYKKHSIVLILSVIILFSPLPRLIKIIKYPIGVIRKGKETYYSTLPEENKGHSIKKQYELANYINKNAGTDKVLLISTGSVEVLLYFNFDYKYSFPQSAFYLNYKATKYLKDRALADLKDAQIIILQNYDYSEIMYFTDDTSESAIKKNKIMWNYINTNFTQDTVIDSVFTIFKRKSSN